MSYINETGWNPISGTITRVDGGILTIPGDQTGLISPYGKLRMTDGSSVMHYWPVEKTPTYDGTKTTIKLVQHSDSTFSAGTWTDLQTSRIAQPKGWPSWFYFGPATDGFSTPPGIFCRFRIENMKLTYYTDISANGVSNSVHYRQQLPTKTGDFGRNLNWPCAVVDNNNSLAAPGCVSVWQNNDWIDIYTGWNFTGNNGQWTPSSYKGAAFWLECDLSA